MRILLVVHCLGSGGAETLARNLALEFAARGHAVCVAYVSDAISNRASVEFEQMLKEEFGGADIDVEEIGHISRRRPWTGARRLRQIARRFRPDVVHMHLAYGLIFQALGWLTLPTVYTHHNIRVGFPASLFRIFDRFVDRYIAICRSCEVMLREHVRKPVELIYNGAPASFASPGARKSLARDPLVLSVGTFSRQKDYGLLLDAAALLVPRMDQAGRRIRFQIAGSGPEEPSIRQKALDLNLQDRVEFLGTRRDVVELMRRADLLVNSSQFEGLPITLIEGALSGLPIVATNVGGNPEIVEDGVNGLLVPPHRADLLSCRIEEMLGDEQRYLAFSRAATEVSTRFTLDACATRHLALYAAVATSTSGRSRLQ